jgi:molybdopterin converting factor small subunit
MAEILIRLPQPFRGYLGGADSLTVEADDVAGALAALAVRSSALGERLLTPEGGLRRFVHLYRGDEDIRRLQGLETKLEAGNVLMVLVAMAGG